MAQSSWYFVHEGARQGPIDEDSFREQVRDGRIAADTLVWQPGLGEWKPYAELFPPRAPGEPPPLHAPGSPSTASFCTLCGRRADERDLLLIDHNRVCLHCKPDFAARVREGFTDTSGLPFAGFWVRFGALVLDYVVLGAFNGLLVLPIYFAMASFSAGLAQVLLIILSALLPYVCQAVYEIYMVGKWGATLGKMAFAIQVVTAEGRGLSYLHSTGRHFAKHISGLILGLGYLMAAFDPEKKALHDMICSTRVVRK